MRPTTAARKRAAPARGPGKELRREQLIKATIRSVARRGFSGTTMAEVTREARLSLGIVNLHFQSKDKLLVETLRYLADEYKQAWEDALERSGPRAADRLAALMELDFSRAVCDRNKLAVWFAFWGEAKSRPTYQRICAQYDHEYNEQVCALCRAIVTEGDYPGVDPEAVATGLAAMTDGLWLDMLITPDVVDRKLARKACFSFLAAIFPAHFTVAP
ncbi:MAG: transcriptional regulator BetI [Gammaproteobacteria bacterium]|nr:transcriptional regulator BetI [Gammaproteobacteria bacterium]